MVAGDPEAVAARARLALLREREREREREVAQAVGCGLSNAQIARELHLVLPTAKTHVSRILAIGTGWADVQAAVQGRTQPYVE